MASKIFEAECLPRSKWLRVTVKKNTAEAVAAVGVDPQAIAFVDLAAIPAAGQNVKVLAIKVGRGEKAKIIKPTPENIKNAMYPLSQRYFLYVHPKARDAARTFEAFITSVLAIEPVRQAGLIPLADAAIQRAAKDALAKAKAAAEKAAAGKGKAKRKRR